MRFSIGMGENLQRSSFLSGNSVCVDLILALLFFSFCDSLHCIVYLIPGLGLRGSTLSYLILNKPLQ